MFSSSKLRPDVIVWRRDRANEEMNHFPSASVRALLLLLCSEFVSTGEIQLAICLQWFTYREGFNIMANYSLDYFYYYCLNISSSQGLSFWRLYFLSYWTLLLVLKWASLRKNILLDIECSFNFFLNWKKTVSKQISCGFQGGRGCWQILPGKRPVSVLFTHEECWLTQLFTSNFVHNYLDCLLVTFFKNRFYLYFILACHCVKITQIKQIYSDKLYYSYYRCNNRCRSWRMPRCLNSLPLKPEVYETINDRTIAEGKLLNFLAEKNWNVCQDEIVLLSANKFDSGFSHKKQTVVWTLTSYKELVVP